VSSSSETALDVLNSIPEDFVDDGCSNAPDSIFCKPIYFACRIHDFRYCTRAHPEGTMCPAHRKAADKELRRNMCTALPWYSQWIRWIYYRAVRRFGTLSAYNSCGPRAGNLCRHNLRPPTWMIANWWNTILEDV